MEVVGILTPGEEKHTFSPPNDIKNRRLWFELDGLSKAASYVDGSKAVSSVGIFQATKSHSEGSFPMVHPHKSLQRFLPRPPEHASDLCWNLVYPSNSWNIYDTLQGCSSSNILEKKTQ